MVRSRRATAIILAAILAAFAVANCNQAAAQRRGLFSRPTTPTQLIVLDQVQIELKLNDEQKKQIKEITEQLRKDVRALSSGLSREERREKQAELTESILKLGATATGQIHGVLEDAQQKRLGQIVIWVQGSAALAAADLATKLKLTEAQQKQIADIGEASQQKRTELVRSLRDRDRRANFLSRFAELRQEVDQERIAVLNSDQKSTYLELKGTKFELTRTTRSGTTRTRRPTVQTASQRRIETRTYHFKAAEKDMDYALFVPSKYDTTKKYPLIVALHGLGSNPQQIMHYRGLTDLAEKHGYIVVAPMGYNTTGWYGSRRSSRRGNSNKVGELSEKDVMNVLALVRKEFNVADERIYLMGHSMGGGGTWHLGIKYPSIWAALAPIAPAIYREPDELEKIKHIPVIVVQGDNDRLVPVRGARKWVAKMKELGMEHVYIEVAGGGHVNIAYDNMPKIVEFFNKHSKEK